jgi:molybdate transport system ATP-binding protein
MAIILQCHLKWKNFSLTAHLRLPDRGVTLLSGSSGSGKTSLLRFIAGFIKQSGNFLEVSGKIWQSQNVFYPAYRRSVGFVFQDSCLFEHLTVEKNILYGWQRATSERRPDSQSIIKGLNLSSLLMRAPQSLSGGEKSRVAIARAIAMGPNLLLLDEALVSLDRESQEIILTYLYEFQKSSVIPLIYVSHSQDEMTSWAQTKILISDGQCVQED